MMTYNISSANKRHRLSKAVIYTGFAGENIIWGQCVFFFFFSHVNLLDVFLWANLRPVVVCASRCELRWVLVLAGDSLGSSETSFSKASLYWRSYTHTHTLEN